MFFAGADNRIRTGDLILTKDVLYLLSHISECFIIIAKECAFVNGFLNICGKEKSATLSLTSVARKGEQRMVSPKYIKETFLIVFFSLVRKERKGQKEESIDSRLGDADTHASHMCQSLF